MTCAPRQVGPMLRRNITKMIAKRATNPKREDRDTIFLALRISYQQMHRRKVDVLHSQARALEKSQAGAVEQLRHEARDAVHRAQDALHLLSGEHERHAWHAWRADE